MERFKIIIFNNPNNKTCNEFSTKLLTSDLSLLVAQGWVSYQALEHFCNVFSNKRRDAIITMMAQLNAIHRDGYIADKVTVWKQNFVKRLCIIFNVGKDKLNESYLADEVRGGSHWSCLLIDIFLGN